jgi:hypothetical protein
MKALLMACGLLGACATSPTVPTGAEPQAYWPLRGGEVMLFEALTAGGTVKRTVRIKARKDGWFQAGRGQRLRHDGDGLFDGHRYLMRRPLVVGHGWHAIPKPGVIERFVVVRVDARCPKGLLPAPACLAIEARQNLGNQVLLTRWWYGKGVGLLQVEVFLQTRVGQLKRQSRLRRVSPA